MVAESVVEEVAHRTPSFYGWQTEKWWTHCGDAAQFIGLMGRQELELLGVDSIEAIRKSVEYKNWQEWERIFATLDKQGSPTAYLFQCTQCQGYGGYIDYN